MAEDSTLDAYEALDDGTILPEMDRGKSLMLTFVPGLNSTSMMPDNTRCYMLCLHPWAVDRDGVHGVSSDVYYKAVGDTKTSRFYPWRTVIEAFQPLDEENK